MRIVLLVVGVLGVIPETFTPQEKREALEELSKNLFKSRIEYLGEEKGLGVIATEDIEIGDLIAHEKEHLAPVSFETFEWSAYFEKESEIVFAVARIIYERLVNMKQAKSNLWAHIPSSTIETIHNWTEPELEYFNKQFSFSIKILDTEFEVSTQKYSETIHKIPGIHTMCPMCLTKEAWVWGYATIQSRRFSTTKYLWKLFNNYKYSEEDKNSKITVIMPSIESFNHMPIPLNSKTHNLTTGVQFYSNNSAALYSEKNFKKGEEVCFEYDKHSNLKLLMSYGFVLDRNVNDIILVSRTKTGDCPDNLYKATALGKCIFTSKVFELDQKLLKYILMSNTRVEDNLEFEELFEKNPGLRSTLVHALQGYRFTQINSSLTRCLENYEAVKQRLTESLYNNHRYKLIDRLCASSYWSFFQHLKLVDRTLLKYYTRILFPES